ncbi:hypothetical protein DFS34DRAFT_622550 [Phlyctochytrium arcticum]|nr:hypothetical protein DFS34DRAFT_622550 [Phlyctochytrium arcticum]
MGFGNEPDILQAGIQFATAQMRTQILLLFMQGQLAQKNNETLIAAYASNWEPSKALKTTAREMATRMVLNPNKKTYFGDSDLLAKKLIDEEVGVTRALGRKPHIKKEVTTLASACLTVVKRDLKSRIFRGGKIVRTKLDDFAADLFQVEAANPAHVVRAAVLRTLSRKMPAKSRTPHQFWKSVSNALKQIDEKSPAVKPKFLDDLLAKDRRLYKALRLNEVDLTAQTSTISPPSTPR